MIKFKEFLTEAPSIEDQLKAAESVVNDLKGGASKTEIPIANSNIVVDAKLGFGKLPPKMEGSYRSLPALFDVVKQFGPGVSKLKEKIRIPGSEIVVSSDISPISAEIAGAHEGGGHGYQQGAQMRDVANQKNVDPMNRKQKAQETQIKREDILKRRGANITDLQRAEYSSYKFDPQEVNARSVQGGHTIMRDLKNVLNKVASLETRNTMSRDLELRNAAMKYGMDVAGVNDKTGELPDSATRHQRSQLKRQKMLAAKDARSAVARGIQQSFVDGRSAFKNFDEVISAYKSKKRNEEIQQRVEEMRAKRAQLGQVQTTSSEIAKGAKVAKPIAAAALKALPVIGTAASVAAMANRAQAGDYVGAGLEAASEVADYIPGVGTAASMGIQGYLADRDMSDEERKEAEKKAARQALRSMNVHSPRY